MNSKILSEFKNPGSEYRGAPFWAWNGKLEPEELRRQIRVMNRMGLGGFFMHSRVGLATAYMSDEWMDCVKACVDEAKKLNMKAWLYDEDRWPSGAAGGLVTRDPKYRSRSLVMRSHRTPRSFKWDQDTLVAFSAYIRSGNATEVKRIPKGQKPAKLSPGQTILSFHVQLDPCSSWYNGYTYLDTMSHAAVQEFIAVTHQAYSQEIKKAFGRSVPGIFTDEPNYGYHHGAFLEKGGVMRAGSGPPDASVPWTDKLPSIFKQRYGYDIRHHMVEVFLNVDGKKMTPARWHYHDCITFLFVDAFGRQIGEWCDQNKMEHTGHVLAEATLSSQTQVVGSCMRFYEHMQAPGMDLLTEHNREYDTAKQVSSVAHQFGRRWRLTETYGCTGWDFNFAGHKALGDWQAALGINLRAQHLAWYTMQGQAKRDYPAGIFYQSPWWEAYPKVEDYFARIHVLMSRGQEIRDILVIHPVESVWSVLHLGNGQNIALDNSFWRTRDALLAANLDFDYGDEDILSRHARIKTSGETPIFVVGRAEYKSVLVPAMRTMRKSTLALLRRFHQAGGTVVFAGEVADHVDALPSEAVGNLATQCITTTLPRLPKALEPSSRRVSITDGQGRQIRSTLYCLRENTDAYYLFICNTGHSNFGKRIVDPMVKDRQLVFPEVNIEVFVPGSGDIQELVPDTGEILAANGKRTGTGWQIQSSLDIIGSRLFVLNKKKSRANYPQRKKLRQVRKQSLAISQWDFRLSEQNCLVLDRPRYKIGANGWQKTDEILRVDAAVRKSLGILPRGGRMVQPWARPKPEKVSSTIVNLQYTFDVADLPTGPLQLALEEPATFAVKANGTPVSMDAESGWWVDRSLITVPIDHSLLKLGHNKLELTCDYTESHPGLEIVYLLGHFGARVDNTKITLTKLPAKLKLGDWVKQGLAFYGGSVTYDHVINPRLKKGQRLIVRVPDYRGTALRVAIDGNVAGIVAWAPNEVDITDLLPDGKCTLSIEVLSHRRNSHGPHHLGEKWPPWTGPEQYISSDWIDGYQLVPCGLMPSPELVIMK